MIEVCLQGVSRGAHVSVARHELMFLINIVTVHTALSRDEAAVRELQITY